MVFENQIAVFIARGSWQRWGRWDSTVGASYSIVYKNLNISVSFTELFQSFNQFCDCHVNLLQLSIARLAQRVNKKEGWTEAHPLVGRLPIAWLGLQHFPHAVEGEGHFGVVFIQLVIAVDFTRRKACGLLLGAFQEGFEGLRHLRFVAEGDEHEV